MPTGGIIPGNTMPGTCTRPPTWCCWRDVTDRPIFTSSIHDMTCGTPPSDRACTGPER